MEEEMNTSELLVAEAKDNRTREILAIVKESKSIEEAVEKIEALLKK